MSVSQVTLIYALLAVAGALFLFWLGVLAIASRFSDSVADSLDTIRERLAPYALPGAFTVALLAVVGSLYFSEIAQFEPCRLCWYQRIAMYPLAVILLVAALRRDVRAGVQYAFVFPIVGILIAIYHIYLEQNPSAQPSSCKVGGATCATKWIEKFGYITIPVLSITAFAAILTLLAMAWSRRDAAAPQEPDAAVDPDAAAARV